MEEKKTSAMFLVLFLLPTLIMLAFYESLRSMAYIDRILLFDVLEIIFGALGFFFIFSFLVVMLIRVVGGLVAKR